MRWQDVIPCRPKVVGVTAAAVPLSIRELARCFPKIWASDAAVRSELQRMGLMGIEPLKEYLLGVRYPLAEVEYRRPNVPGPPMRALVSGDADRLRETLESVVGPVSSFQLLPIDSLQTAAVEPAVESDLEPVDRRSSGEAWEVSRATDIEPETAPANVSGALPAFGGDWIRAGELPSAHVSASFT